MKTIFKMLAFLLIVGMAIFCVSCPDPEKDPEENEETLYDIIVTQPTGDNSFTVRVGNGADLSTNTKAAEGRTITLTAKPATGFDFSSFTLDPVQTQSGTGNTRTFTMPASNVSVSAAFVPGVIKFLIIRGTHEGGNFTIEPDDMRAEEGDTVTLTPTANQDYNFARFDTEPPQTITNAGDGKYTFVMPAVNVTVNAVFNAIDPTASGVKTLTVVGGLGRLPGGETPATGTNVWAGTRHITVTVTLESGAITDVVIGHPIENNNGGNLFQNVFRDNANNLAAAIKAENNADAPFSPTGNYSNDQLTAWEKHEAAIRDAVKDAVTDIYAGKKNRVLAGGGLSGTDKTPFTADGVNLSGEATIVGSGAMRGGRDSMGDTNNWSTDFSVRVVLTNGIITTITASGDETRCLWNGTRVGNATTNWWPGAILAGNHYNFLQTGGGTVSATNPQSISGATYSGRSMRELIERGINKLANEY